MWTRGRTPPVLLYLRGAQGRCCRNFERWEPRLSPTRRRMGPPGLSPKRADPPQFAGTASPRIVAPLFRGDRVGAIDVVEIEQAEQRERNARNKFSCSAAVRKKAQPQLQLSGRNGAVGRPKQSNWKWRGRARRAAPSAKQAEDEGRILPYRTRTFEAPQSAREKRLRNHRRCGRGNCAAPDGETLNITNLRERQGTEAGDATGRLDGAMPEDPEQDAGDCRS